MEKEPHQMQPFTGSFHKKFLFGEGVATPSPNPSPLTPFGGSVGAKRLDRHNIKRSGKWKFTTTPLAPTISRVSPPEHWLHTGACVNVVLLTYLIN